MDKEGELDLGKEFEYIEYLEKDNVKFHDRQESFLSLKKQFKQVLVLMNFDKP